MNVTDMYSASIIYVEMCRSTECSCPNIGLWTKGSTVYGPVLTGTGSSNNIPLRAMAGHQTPKRVAMNYVLVDIIMSLYMSTYLTTLSTSQVIWHL